MKDFLKNTSYLLAFSLIIIINACSSEEANNSEEKKEVSNSNNSSEDTENMQTTDKDEPTSNTENSTKQTSSSKKLRYAVTNPDGSVEVLYIDIEDDILEYSKGNAGKIIELETVSVKKNSDGAVFQVKFPNDNKIYTITSNIAGWLCENPDGTTQFFEFEDKYVCENSDGTVEYIYVQNNRGPNPLMFIYSSSKNPKRLKLGLVQGSNEEYTIVQFPSGSVYKLKISGSTLTSSLIDGDGTKQVFYKE